MASSDEHRPAQERGGAKEPSAPNALSTPMVFPSGRQMIVRAGAQSEVLELRSPRGEVELSIELTERGPIVKLRGGQLVLDSSDSIKIQCRSLEIAAREDLTIQSGSDLSLRSGREIRVKSAKQTFIDGDYVNLNCLDRTGYHDEGVEYPEESEEVEAEDPGVNDPHGSGR